MASHSSTVYQFKDVTIVYDAAAACTLTIYTDLPANSEAGGGLNTVALGTTQVTLPLTAGRGTFTAPLDQNGATGNYLEGTLIKFELTSTGVCRLYSGVLRTRKVGVYLQPGQSWRSLELAL